MPIFGTGESEKAERERARERGCAEPHKLHPSPPRWASYRKWHARPVSFRRAIHGNYSRRRPTWPDATTTSTSANTRCEIQRAHYRPMDGSMHCAVWGEVACSSTRIFTTGNKLYANAECRLSEPSAYGLRCLPLKRKTRCRKKAVSIAG
jgi:hypothetical protein